MEAPRETIIAHAARLFAERGFEQTSLQDVASAVGVSKAAVYHYFRSKQVIYDEIVVGLLEGLHDYVEPLVREEPLVERRVATFMRAHAEYFEANYAGFVALLHGVSGIGAAVGSERQVAVRDRYEGLLRSLLSEGIAAGRFATDDVALTARGILSMLNWMSRWYKPGGPKRAAQVAEHYSRMVHDGLLLAPGAGGPQTDAPS